MKHPAPGKLQAFALGRCDQTERLLLEAHLHHCGQCRRIYGEIAERELGQETMEPATEPMSPDELEAIFARIDAIAPRPAVAHPEEELFPKAILHDLSPPASWRWSKIGASSVRISLLMKEPSTGTQLFCLHCEAGGKFPRHRHRGEESVVLLAGSYVDDFAELSAGDWYSLPDASEHDLIAGVDGCWCLVRTEAGGIEFLG